MKIQTNDTSYQLGNLDIYILEKLGSKYGVSLFELRERFLEGSLSLTWAERNLFTAASDGAVISKSEIKMLADSCHVFIPEMILEDLLRMLLFRSVTQIVVRIGSEKSDLWPYEAVSWNPLYQRFAAKQGLRALQLYEQDPSHSKWKLYNATHSSYR